MDTFFTVYDFMVKDLHLSGNELIIYALIYSFRVMGGFCGAQDYIAQRVGVSRVTANKCINSLVKKGLIEERRGSGKTNIYLSRNFTGSVKNLYSNLSKGFTQTCQESLHNNKTDIKTDIYNDKKKAHCKSAPSYNIEKYNAFVENYELKYQKESEGKEG
ncbi:MAG: helix-turn-helix domain-containing protein [Clostridia bacterium]|nr:helix-turn-helix domain-containing protein [Clostridia bacterium]